MKNRQMNTVRISGIYFSPSYWHLLGAFALVTCFSLLQTLRAVNPPPDGVYPNGNTAEGDSALFTLSSGMNNTAVGAGALFSDTTGSNNTAIGFQTLNSNSTVGDNTATGYR